MTASTTPRGRRRRPASAPNHPLYPFAWRTPVLVATGLNDSGPAHWQTLWQNRYASIGRVAQADYATPDLARWADAVAQAVESAAEPPVVVAHSFGCLAVVRAARHHGATLAGALLVAPADPARFDIAIDLLACDLPFPSTLVASTNDPWLKIVKAGALAAQWGSAFVCAGHAGHINAESGHGGWPEGFALLRDLGERAAAAGTLRATAHAARPSAAVGRIRA